MNDLEQMSAEAEIGEEARKFLESDLGKCLCGMAKQEVDAAVLEFDQIDPGDIKKIRELQLRVKFGLSFQNWLVELFEKGNEAMQAFQQGANKQ